MAGGIPSRARRSHGNAQLILRARIERPGHDSAEAHIARQHVEARVGPAVANESIDGTRPDLEARLGTNVPAIVTAA